MPARVALELSHSSWQYSAGAEGLELPLIIRFADSPAPVARPPSSRCRRALFSAKPKPSSNAGHTTSSDDEPEDYSEGVSHEFPFIR